MAKPKGKRTRVERPREPPPKPVNPADNTALEALAEALAPRVIRLMRERIAAEPLNVDPSIAKFFEEIGYVLRPTSESVEAEAVLRMIAEEAVRAVKERLAPPSG